VNIHEKYMHRCIQLAKNGLGTTYPNPLVGCVIVHDNKIIGEGWHHKAGQAHAEVNSIEGVCDDSLLKEAILYVSLEPCSHFGKTPPCTNMIIDRGIKKVVIGSSDPNPKVSGQGVQRLKDAGCNVTIGVSQKECDELNKRFFTFQLKKRPYIFLKWAQTEDGFIAPMERKQQGPVWITSPHTRQVVHKMRAKEQAILVGTNTVIADNPSLTTRYWKGNSPTRIVLDRNLRILKDTAVYDGKVKTIFITEKKSDNEPNLFFESIDFSENVAQQICDIVHKHGIQSLIVEGGAQMLQTFIESSSWDEAFVFIGNTTFEAGVKAPKFKGTLVSEEKITNDILHHYKNPSL
jgi:diaminohydroxyphosphoribosylaminopyrimidine deaminase / 5-amino-6-(5-phosphoribosylamino)uracil reductase